MEGNFEDWSGADVKFGDLSHTSRINVLQMLPIAISLAIVGGLLGAFFININTRVNSLRSKCLKAKWIKPLETAFFCFATASALYFTPY